jgi:hypothetical protein
MDPFQAAPLQVVNNPGNGHRAHPTQPNQFPVRLAFAEDLVKAGQATIKPLFDSSHRNDHTYKFNRHSHVHYTFSFAGPFLALKFTFSFFIFSSYYQYNSTGMSNHDVAVKIKFIF